MDEVLRPLGGMEYAYWLMDRAARTNFVFAVRVSPGVPEDALDEAVALVQARHPLARAAIAPDEKGLPVFAPCARPVEIRRRAAETGLDFHEAAIREMERERDEMFPAGEGPLSRLAVILRADGSEVLVFTFHHAAADARSAALYIKDVLEAADGVLKGERPVFPPVLETGPAESLFPPAHRGFRSLFRALGWMAAVGFRKMVLKRYDFPAPEAFAPPHERRERHIIRVLGREETARARAAAKERGLSLHSLFCAAQLMALAEACGRPAPGLVNLSLVDLRGRLDPPVAERALNVLVSTVESFHRVRPEAEAWDLAAEIHAALLRGLSAGEPFTAMPWMCRLVRASAWRIPPNEAGARSMLAQGEATRPRLSVVSNVGPLPIPKDFGAFSVSDAFFLVPLSGATSFGSGVAGFDSKTTWTFTHSEPLVGRALASRLADRSVEIFRGALS